MKIVAAPDKFKGTIPARDAAEIICKAFRSAVPGVEAVALPLADGGEGTVRALTEACGGSFRKFRVRGPRGGVVVAETGCAGERFFLEMASASGMALLGKEELDPMAASTYGTGELILHALENGAREIVIGIGGSATNDGGAGMAEALGCVFRDSEGRILTDIRGGDLNRIASIDRSHMTPLLKKCRIRIASDVQNPLLGPLGATAVYSGQKGSTAETRPLLEAGLANLKRLSGAEERPGDGAAGGLGFGLRVFCGADSESGAKLAMESVGFRDCIRDAALVITGEGCTDSQTEAGKLCSEVAFASRAAGIPCVLLSGGIKTSREKLLETFSAVFVSGIGRESTEEILAHAREDLSAAARSIAAVFAGAAGR